jgi:type II secretory pathway component HofQ
MSTISQLDADQKALDDINTNGQNAANNNPNGVCTNISCGITFSIPGGGGISVIDTRYRVSMDFHMELIFLGKLLVLKSQQ